MDFPKVGKGGASANSNSGYLKPSPSNTPEKTPVSFFLPSLQNKQLPECFTGLTAIENRACSTAPIYIMGKMIIVKKLQATLYYLTVLFLWTHFNSPFKKI